MPQIRQLAAIMFTDIVGYTALMGKDEQKAFESLSKNRELQKPIIEKYGGRWIKELGDGVLASFATVSDAVYAAKEIQEQCRLTGKFSLRIGIHQGEIVVEDDDVFGDAVNVASRIQAIAPVGGIFITETIHQNISNKADVYTRFVKTEKLKNVKESLRIFEVLLNGETHHSKRITAGVKNIAFKKKSILIASTLIVVAAALFFYSNSSRNSVFTSEKSIAVLPFVNMSDDKEQEYFSDGLSEEVSNLLAKVQGLKVIARTSSFAFKGKNEDIRTISEKLGVAHILEGSVRKSGDRVRVTAQLINSSNGRQMWNEVFETKVNDVFQVQDEIATAVVKQLKIKLLEPIRNIKESKPEVHNLILQGNYFHEKLDKESVLKSLQLYEQALALDSSDARTWAMVAKTYSRAAWQNYVPQQEGYEKARQAVLKGYSIDPDNTDVLLVYAGIKLYYDFDWKKAEELLQKCLALEPANAYALNTLGALYQTTGNGGKAIKVTSQALIYDPLRPIVYSNQGANYTYINELNKGIEMYRKALEINPQFQRAHMYIGRNYLLQGKVQIALSEIQKENVELFKQFGLILAYHASGDRKQSKELLQRFVSLYGEEWPYLATQLYAYTGAKEQAIKWLQRAYDQNDSWLVWIKRDPLLKTVWNHPGYIAILKKMNLQ